jgi:site-specific recombinase XerD
MTRSTAKVVPPHLFVSERGGPMTSSNVRKMLTRAGEGLGMPIHPHMLRHGCGFKLANQGIDTRSIQAFMGHSSIASTVIYTESAVQGLLEGLNEFKKPEGVG